MARPPTSVKKVMTLSSDLAARQAFNKWWHRQPFIAFVGKRYGRIIWLAAQHAQREADAKRVQECCIHAGVESEPCAWCRVATAIREAG